jgi:hypothetical protein
LLSFFSAFFATNAFANPGSGLEIKVSGTAPIVNFTTTKEGERGSVTYKDEYDYAEWMVGFNGRISGSVCRSVHRGGECFGEWQGDHGTGGRDPVPEEAVRLTGCSLTCFFHRDP